MATAKLALCLVAMAAFSMRAYAGAKCQFVEGDCKPNPNALPKGATGAAASWVALLKQYQTMRGPVSLAEKKVILGPSATRFMACGKLTGAATCAANADCKMGAAGKCVISEKGIAATFGLTPSSAFGKGALPVLKLCNSLVAQPSVCAAT